MNLHIVPDSKFSDSFYANLKELGLTSANKFVVRSNQQTLKFISHKLPFAKLYSAQFNELVGETSVYEKVFIHQFSPLMYRWVALNSFREVNWCVWGSDIYNLPGIEKNFIEPMTWEAYSKGSWKKDLLYTLKLFATSMYFKRMAYDKIGNILTWMDSEYRYVINTLKMPEASWKFFFYENHLPYEHLDTIKAKETLHPERQRLKFIVGNSGTDTNNHFDLVRRLADSGVQADLVIPVSYGSPAYISFLKNNLDFYQNGRIEFLDTFLGFNDYVRLLLNCDGLIMNHLRPQGYGNILMMMYLDKPVLLNESNLSIPDLDANNLRWLPISEIKSLQPGQIMENKEAVKKLLSHQGLLNTYRGLFGSTSS